MATKLKNLKLNEVSLVDRGANQHAHITLFKRDGEVAIEKDMYDVGRFADLISSLAYLTRSSQYEADDEGDNSPVPAKLRGWLQQGGQIFQQMAVEEVNELVLSAGDIAKAVSDGAAKINDASDALEKSIRSIIGDDQSADGEKLDAVTTSFSQYTKHIEQLIPQVNPASAAADIAAAKSKGNTNMTEAEKKIADEQIKKIADTEAALAKVQKENAFLKLSDAHKAYVAEKAMDEAARDAFIAKSEADRDAQIKAAPVVKAVDPEIAKRDAELSDLRKRLEATEEKNAVAEFAKKAIDLGLTETQGETLRKAHSGDKEAMGKIEALIKSLTEQVKTGKVFEEFGNKGGDATSGTAKLDAKVAEMQKADSSITRAQAIAKIAADPALREVWDEYKNVRAA